MQIESHMKVRPDDQADEIAYLDLNWPRHLVTPRTTTARDYMTALRRRYSTNYTTQALPQSRWMDLKLGTKI